MKIIGPLLKPRRWDGGTLPSYSLSYIQRDSNRRLLYRWQKLKFQTCTECFLDILGTDTQACILYHRLSKGTTTGHIQIQTFPVAQRLVTSYLDYDENMSWTAVGDAAMAFDPLPSQGMIRSLRMSSESFFYLEFCPALYLGTLYF